ncbi:uncharacterized protein BP01DRAFT_356757 [Aspergillus saccharolyticus JOP 1030-1]|uniref:GET complex, subunit GET2 n=1 Tax=Aspergillus saccharolyticus JOP 1030-1 TaxID=1450539 RepID=A0A318ZF21_9EURO|nr:hypothetical protein BP01DRAFT_356757 [Aspergillus saccharolyticus JOP 1030-1]PYH45277.1 hypothetical protein BP01DRAFT_356757 [Aspergillus saccharolyticus JOP 1030-1]
MSSPAEESPAQRAARLRRERREAKIKEGGAARLEKITSLSGRAPASLREDTSPSPSPQPEFQSQHAAPPAPPFPTTAPTPAQPQTHPGTIPDQAHAEQPDLDPETRQAQQELFRALLRQPAPSPGPQQPQGPGGGAAPNPAADLLGLDAQDPTLKLLNSLMASSAGGGSGSGNPLENINLADFGLGGDGKESATDLLTNFGVPPFLAGLIGDAMRPKTEAEKREIAVWKVVHMVFAVLAGIYLLFVLGSAVGVYGRAPPAPATAQDPFTVFMTGEVVLSGARALLRSRDKGFGLGMAVQLVRDVIRDGSLVVFLFGMASWWLGERLV